MTPPDRTTDLEDLFAAVVDEFTDRQARGERPTVDEYAARHPELAADLRAVLGMLPALGPPATPTPDPQSTTPLGRSDAPRPPELPGFAVERELGRGGMGVVYLARQAALNRPVALKMVLSGGHATAEERARFLAEAEVIARLSHPGVVQVHEFGTDPDGRPFFALEYLAGGSLADRLRDGPLAPAVAAGLVEALARAVGYAHSAGVVHRDLKPANVLFDAAGNPKVTDFGLAKGGEAAAGLTATGAIMGTPSYMSPEQAAGRTADLGPAADVYSLGAVLYECLTGGPPFRGTSIFDTLTQVKTREPVAVRALQPAVPRDLETIALKCLQKEPGKRYVTAAELADDLRRFLDGKPILARPVGPAERAAKWVRRNPVLAGLWAAGLVAVVAGVGVLVSLRYSGRLADSLKTAETQRDRADTAKAEADRLRGEADRLKGLAEANARLANRFRYGADMNLVAQAWRDDQPALARSLLARHQAPAAGGDDFRGFEWFHLARASREEVAVLPSLAGWADAATVTSLAVRPDDGRVVWGGSLGGLAAADPAGRSAPVAARWDPDPEPAPGTRTPARASMTRPVLTPDGRRAVGRQAVRGGQLKYVTWDADAGEPVARWFVGDPTAGQPNASAVDSASVSPDGRYFADYAPADGRVRVWEVETGRPAGSIPPPKGAPGVVAVTAVGPGGRVAAAVWANGLLGCYGLPDGRLIRSAVVRWPAVAIDPTGATVFAARTVNGNHQLIAVGTAGPGEAVRTVGTAPALPNRLVVSPDGRRVAGGTDGGPVLVWEAAGGPARVYRGHEGRVTALAFSPDGRRVYSAAADGTVRGWDADRPPGGVTRAARVHAPLPDLDGWVVVRDEPAGGRAVAVAGPAGEPGRKLLGLTGDDAARADLLAVAVSPDGRRVAVCTAGGVTVVDPADGRVVGRLPRHRSVEPPAFSADGRRLALHAGSGRAVYEAAGRAEADHLPAGQLAFAPDGRRVAYVPARSRPENVTAEEWLRTLRSAPPREVRIRTAGGPDGPVLRPAADPGGLAFSPDGRLLAVAHEVDPSIGLWDADAGRLLFTLYGHSDGGIGGGGLAFSPDGRRLASCGGDGWLRLWDTATGQPTFAAEVRRGQRQLPAFSRDGRRLTAYWPGGDATVWEAPAS